MTIKRIILGIKDQPEWETHDAVVIQFDTEAILAGFDALRESDCFEGAILKYHPPAAWAEDVLDTDDYEVLSWLSSTFFDDESAIDYDTSCLAMENPIFDGDMYVQVALTDENRLLFRISYNDENGTYDTYELAVANDQVQGIVDWEDAVADWEEDDYDGND